MTQEQHKDERALKDLFDSTATAADDESLHRSARHAARIPEQRQRLGWLHGARAWGAAIALLGAAAGAFLLTHDSWNGPRPSASMLHPTPSHRSVTQDDDGWLAELGLDEEDNSNTGDSESASEPLAGLSLGASANIAPLEILNPNDTPALADAIAVLDEINNEPR